MADRYDYLIRDHELLVVENTSGKLAWKGKPNGLEVELAIPVPTSDDCIVLLNWKRAKSQSVKNLLRCGPDGKIKWEVSSPKKELPDVDRSNDVYDLININKSMIEANSLLSFLDYIDLESGNILHSSFLK